MLVAVCVKAAIVVKRTVSIAEKKREGDKGGDETRERGGGGTECERVRQRAQDDTGSLRE